VISGALLYIRDDFKAVEKSVILQVSRSTPEKILISSDCVHAWDLELHFFIDSSEKKLLIYGFAVNLTFTGDHSERDHCSRCSWVGSRRIHER
jgi:hypothetical protein